MHHPRLCLPTGDLVSAPFGNEQDYQTTGAASLQVSHADCPNAGGLARPAGSPGITSMLTAGPHGPDTVLYRYRGQVRREKKGFLFLAVNPEGRIREVCT